MNKNDILRRIPKMDELLKDGGLELHFAAAGRTVVTEAARTVIDRLRQEILSLEPSELDHFDIEQLNIVSIARRVMAQVEDDEANHLIPVINATGTILHTNLGRAPLCKEAVENVAAVSRGYSNLEYDLAAGGRGSRHNIVSELICELTGAEDAMLVNNNAAATMIVLSAMAEGQEVIVSRGELVEIGGAFRIPDIMEQSGAKLHEIGTTNKTKPSDYENAIDEERTAALMKVHTSNYRIMGFTQDTSLEELVEIGRKHDLPVIFDMGNGLMVDLSAYGLDEPNVPASLASGIDVILFSGDKLLGGPQGGIIAGRKKYIEKMKKHPLARALRVDKMTFAAMEETLKKYRDTEKSLRDIPILHMITEPADSMQTRAYRLAEQIQEKNPAFHTEVVPVQDQIGGGSAPMVYLPGFAVAVTSDAMSTQKLETALRGSSLPIVARIHDDRLLLCVRTIAESDVEIIAQAFTAL
jgi:L-seryl-tRNA(Ser) seleniumtransferase